MKSGLKLDALTFDALLSYECTNDTAKLEVLLKDMTIDALKNTLTELNLGVRNKNPNKAVLVRSIVSQWENVKRMAHENHVVATLTDAMATSPLLPLHLHRLHLLLLQQCHHHMLVLPLSKANLILLLKPRVMTMLSVMHLMLKASVISLSCPRITLMTLLTLILPPLSCGGWW